MEGYEFQARLTQLRMKKGVSSRDMSLSIGQNAGYINNIECKKALPSMSMFFVICDYLGVTPSEFFDTKEANPSKVTAIADDLKYLDDSQLDAVSAVVKGFRKV